MTCSACGSTLSPRSITALGSKIEIGVLCSCGDQESRMRALTLESLRETAMAHSSVPSRFREASLDGSVPPDVRYALEAALERLPDLRNRWDSPNLREGIGRISVRGRGVGLFGANGAGKSYAMGAFLAAGRERLIPGMFVPATQLQLELENAQRFDSKASAGAVVAKYARVALLVIDDIDKLLASSAANAVAIFELIDARSREDRPLYATTNLAPAEVAAAVFGRHDRHGIGVDDRFFDMLDWIEYPAEYSRRGMAASR